MVGPEDLGQTQQDNQLDTSHQRWYTSHRCHAYVATNGTAHCGSLNDHTMVLGEDQRLASAEASWLASLCLSCNTAEVVLSADCYDRTIDYLQLPLATRMYV